jgi:Ca2+-binding EF-hand superfamily protein
MLTDAGYQQIDPTVDEEQIVQVIKQVDLNNSGKIDYSGWNMVY